MLYLGLAIITSASIALIFKFSEGRNMDRYVVTSFNYLAASLVSLTIISVNGLQLPFISFSVGPQDFIAAIPPLKSGTDPQSSLLWGLIVGVPAGLFFFFAFIYYQKGIRENGAGLAGAFSKIGILIPMSVSILVWNEVPTVLQWLGIGISLLSILIVNLPEQSLDTRKIRFSLLALFLFSGLAEFSNKVFQKYGLIEDKLVFLFFVFLTAFVVSGFFLILRRKTPEPRAIITGVLVGMPNLFCSYFLILALDGIKASVVFPVYTATTIMVINLGGYFLFDERLAKRERFSVVLMVVALVLINM